MRHVILMVLLFALFLCSCSPVVTEPSAPSTQNIGKCQKDVCPDTLPRVPFP